MAGAKTADVLRRRMQKALKGFGFGGPGFDTFMSDTYRPDQDAFPVPKLVLFALRNVMGCQWTGPGEKVAWSVYCTFLGTPIAFELRKFGFTICYPDGAELNFDRIVGQLQTALRHVEEALRPIALAQADLGNVTIANRFGEFDARYRFFRTLADEAYKRANRKPRKPRKPQDADVNQLIQLGVASMMDGLNAKLSAGREGFFYSTAMVDAYFSRLEHHLALMLAFHGRPLPEGGLVAFLAAKWGAKLKRFLDVTGERNAEVAFAQLKRIKERIRNPFAHGGVENDGGSLHVHIPHIGAVPANFSKIRDSVRFNFLPVEHDDHQSACAVFDEIDRLLASGSLGPVFELIDAGIDPQFDGSMLATYARVIAASPEEREAFIAAWHHEWEKHANMDF
jgi:hypothetical protein